MLRRLPLAGKQLAADNGGGIDYGAVTKPTAKKLQSKNMTAESCKHRTNDKNRRKLKAFMQYNSQHDVYLRFSTKKCVTLQQ
jgi:hypothetical protein